MANTIRELGDLVRIRTGKLDANANDPTGEFPFFTCARETLRISSFSYDCECVLVAGNGDLNVKYYKGKFDAYQRTYVIESADKSELDVRYLYHFMDLYLEQLRHLSIGGVIKYIKLGNLTKAKIPLPPLPEQRRIAAILDKADALRAKRREALAQLDSLTQSIFVELFGDLSGWPRQQLKSVTRDGDKINYGIVQPGSDTEGGVPMIRICDFDGMRINKSGLIRVDQSIEAKHHRSRLSGNEVLFGCVGSIGEVALADKSMAGYNINRAVIRIPVSDKLSSLFLAYYLQSPDAVAHFRKELRTGSQARINIEQLEELLVPIPPTKHQHHFATIVESIERQKEGYRAHLTEMGRLFVSLQHRAFRGKL